MTTLKKTGLFIVSVILTVLAYSNHFKNPFEFDDNHTIVSNLHIRDIHNIPVFFKDAATTSSLPANQAYRPGLTTLNAIDYWIGGEPEPNPFYFHLSIFIAFLVLGFGVFALCKKIMEKSFNSDTTFWASWFVMTWFWVHTANSATINYIIQRADSFSTLMVVAAFCIYLYFPKAQNKFFYMIPIVVGFFVKEPAVMFVGLLAVYKLLFEQNVTLSEALTSHKKALFSVVRQCAVPLLISIVLVIFSRKMTPPLWTSGSSDVLHYALTQPYVILHYVNNFLIPANLVIDSDWKIVDRVLDDKVIIGLSFLIGLIYIAFKTAKNHKPITFGILWFLLTLLPTSSVFPLAEVLNDHRPFFGYIGLCIATVYAVTFLYTKQPAKLKPILVFALPLFLAAHAFGTYHHNSKWNSPESIWKDATVHAPTNGRAWMNYGLALMGRGDFVNADAAFTKAIQLWPDYPYAFINIAILKATQNKLVDAENNFKQAIALDPILPEGYYYYADFLFRHNRTDEAQKQLEEGLKLSPNHADLLQLKSRLNAVASKGGSFAASEVDKALAAVKNNPNHETYLNLSLHYYNNKQFIECIQACEKALQYKPDYDLAFNNICSAYIELKQWDKAVVAGQKGIAINPKNAYLKQNLDYAVSQQKNK